MENVIGGMVLDAAAHPPDAIRRQIHVRSQETNPFRSRRRLQATLPQGGAALFRHHDGKAEPLLEFGFQRFEAGSGKVHDAGTEIMVLLEGEHGEGPMEGVQVPGRYDKKKFRHLARVLFFAKIANLTKFVGQDIDRTNQRYYATAH